MTRLYGFLNNKQIIMLSSDKVVVRYVMVGLEVSTIKVICMIQAILQVYAYFFRLLPQYIEDQYRRVFYVQVIPPTEEEKAALSTTAIIQDLVKHDRVAA